MDLKDTEEYKSIKAFLNKIKMKNLYRLPTDKPSRLIFQGTELVLSKYMEVNEGFTEFNQHIYITSDEEIKDVRPYVGNWHLEKGNVLNKFPDYLTDLSECKLVILTTDPDLIKDGVQTIDDEFLQWYVKNPTCEMVKIKEVSVYKSTTYDQPDRFVGIDYKATIPNNTLVTKTSMIQLRDELLEELQSLKEASQTNEQIRGYREALIKVANNIDAKMLAIEKKQIKNAYEEGGSQIMGVEIYSEQYYNETFGK